MGSIFRTTSIKSTLRWVVMLICSVTLLASLTVSMIQDISFQRDKLMDQVQAYANIIAFNAVAGVLADDSDMENNRLKSFTAVHMINNIHIYKLDPDTNELVYFSSFNNSEIAPIATQFRRVNQLNTPEINNDMLEVARPVLFDNKVIGYVYLRASMKQLSNYMQYRLLLDFIIAVVALSGAYFISQRLQRRLTSPLEQLVSLVQKISRDKDYSVRIPEVSIQEMSVLGRSFNQMLDRIEQQINKLQQAESEIRGLNQGLEHKISERTLALKTSNQELLSTLETLHQYQNQIVETEKMASLGQMVAGVAHEVNTPIGLGVTASTLMLDRLADIQNAFDEKKLTSSQLQRFLSESKENLGIIYRNLERAASLIRSFKQVAVDQSNEDRRQFNMLQLLKEVLLSLRPNLKKTQHDVQIECDEHWEVDSKPGPLNQILINLIMNSLIHAFEHIEKGQILIQVKINDGRCYIHYEDNGAGVPEHIKKRIFDPFVTTKRGEGGSGLGMHLVYNLVTQALNGKISLESSLGQGVLIDFDFPIILRNGLTSQQPITISSSDI